MAKITVADIQENREAINQLRDKKESISEKQQKEHYSIEQEYSNKIWEIEKEIWEIEKEKRNTLNTLRGKQESVIVEFDNSIQTHNQTIKQAERILECLRLDSNKDIAITDDEIEISRYITPHCESLGYLLDDDYLKIKVFIVGNQKPKNKYSLIAIGKSIFTEDLIKLPYGYGADILTHGKGFSLIVPIKDMTNTAELKEYYNKHKAKLLNDVIGEYQKVKAEYLDTMANYSIGDFRELVTWTCPKCADFYTIFNSFSTNYTPQCFGHDPYIDMVKVG